MVLSLLVTFTAYVVLAIARLYLGGGYHLADGVSQIVTVRDKAENNLLSPAPNEEVLEKVLELWFDRGENMFGHPSARPEGRSQQLLITGKGYGYSQSAATDYTEPDELLLASSHVQSFAPGAQMHGMRPTGHAENPKPKPLSLLMNFGLDGVSQWIGSPSADDLQDDCLAGTVFDPFSGFCRPAVCIPISNPGQPSEAASTCSPAPESCRKAIGIPPNATTANITLFLGLSNVTSDASRFQVLGHSIVPLIRAALEKEVITRLMPLIAQETQIRDIHVPQFLPENCSQPSEKIRSISGDRSFCDLLLKVDSLIQVSATLRLERPEHLRNRSESIISMFVHLADAIANKSFHFEVEGLTIAAQGIQHNSDNKSEIIIMDTSWCSMGAVHTYYNEEFIVGDYGNSTVKAHIYIKETNKTYRSGEFKLQVVLRTSTNVIQICQVSHVCDRPLNCTAFEAEGGIVLPNRTLLWNSRHYDVSRYSRHPTNRSKILICGQNNSSRKKNFKNLVLGFDMGDDLSILSMTLTIISIFSLLFTLLIYLVFKELRTLPGLNLMNVMAALVAAQTSHLLSSVGDTRFCHAIGIITHYGFLLGFFFSNVIAWDIYRTFGGKGIAAERRSFRKQFFGNMMYCYLSAGVIVVAAVVLDELDVEHWHVGYAELCWISGARTSAVFFAIPVGVILFVNGVLVAVAFWNLRTQKKGLKGMRIAAGGSVPKQMGLKAETSTFVKIGSIFGFMWIFGFAAGFAKSLTLEDDKYLYVYEIFIYVFLLTQSSQGLFLFMGFGINAANRKRIKKLCKSWKSRGCKLCNRTLCKCSSTGALPPHESSSASARSLASETGSSPVVRF